MAVKLQFYFKECVRKWEESKRINSLINASHLRIISETFIGTEYAVFCTCGHFCWLKLDRL